MTTVVSVQQMRDLLQMFKRINKDSKDVVPFVDVEYYTTQLENLEYTPEIAAYIAKWFKDNTIIPAYSKYKGCIIEEVRNTGSQAPKQYKALGKVRGSYKDAMDTIDSGIVKLKYSIRF
jgi:hypothetical protein